MMLSPAVRSDGENTSEAADTEQIRDEVAAEDQR
jgi:hypothetical protein